MLCVEMFQHWYVILTFGFVLQDGWSYKILQTLYPAPMEIQIPPDGPYFVYNSISTDWDRGDHLQQQENIEYFNSVYSSLSWIDNLTNSCTFKKHR